MEDVTALGGVPALTLLTIFATVYLALAGRKKEAVLTLVVAVGAFVLNTALKSYFDRPRPEVFEAVKPASSSFPSGHAMGSMAIYVTHGVLLARLAPTWVARVFATFSTVTIALAIAFSRMWLGVHYPTDVLAGALLGLAWALTVLCADEVFRRRRPVVPGVSAPAAPGAAGTAAAPGAAGAEREAVPAEAEPA
jgi:undecaprenyl-diphosphatase